MRAAGEEEKEEEEEAGSGPPRRSGRPGLPEEGLAGAVEGGQPGG